MTGMPLLANNMVTSVVRSNDHFQDSLSVPKANTNSKYKAVKYFPYSPFINNQELCFHYYYVLRVVYWLAEEKLNSYLQCSRLWVNHMTVLFFFVSSKRCSLVAYLDFSKFSKIIYIQQCISNDSWHCMSQDTFFCYATLCFFVWDIYGVCACVRKLHQWYLSIVSLELCGLQNIRPGDQTRKDHFLLSFPDFFGWIHKIWLCLIILEFSQCKMVLLFLQSAFAYLI